jgi:hypothetical protein
MADVDAATRALPTFALRERPRRQTDIIPFAHQPTDNYMASSCPWAQLGLSRGASIEEVKRAFKSEAIAWHPDKHASAPEHQRAAAAERFRVESRVGVLLGERRGSIEFGVLRAKRRRIAEATRDVSRRRAGVRARRRARTRDRRKEKTREKPTEKPLTPPLRTPKHPTTGDQGGVRHPDRRPTTSCLRSLEFFVLPSQARQRWRRCSPRRQHRLDTAAR